MHISSLLLLQQLLEREEHIFNFEALRSEMEAKSFPCLSLGEPKFLLKEERIIWLTTDLNNMMTICM